jgi:ABC-type lipoprotein export system ATPase subunit
MTDATRPIVRTAQLCRYYRRGPQEIRAVDQASIDVHPREFLAVVGSSGSGKSTLLNLLAGLDTPTSGNIEFEGASLDAYSRRELAAYRAHKVGMVFQSFNLIHHRSALENVELAMYFNGVPRDERTERAASMLEVLGLGDRMTHRPSDLSGGEQQRVAMARALVKQPAILFADEPTGNLDQDNSRQIVTLLQQLSREGLTVVMVTHDLELARNHAGRIIRMHYGKVIETDSTPGDRP